MMRLGFLTECMELQYIAWSDQVRAQVMDALEERTMPYTEESNPDGTGRREQEQTWKRRNSDFLTNTFERVRTESPPARPIVEYALPKPDAERLSSDADEPIDTDRGMSERHVHDYQVPEPDWEVEP